MKHHQTRRIITALLLALIMMLSAGAVQIESLIPIGHTVGIKMSAEGVLVVRLNDVKTGGTTQCPAKTAGVKEGDLIVAVNRTQIDSNEALQKQIALSAGQTVELTIKREGQTQKIQATPCADEQGVYRIGVLARDSMAGIGTVTYVDPKTGQYGSLGHGICESETGVLMPLKEGSLIYSVVADVQKGKAGEPGSLQGQFKTDHTIGSVRENTESGIFGSMSDDTLYSGLQAIPVADESEITIGKAEILSNIEGDSVRRYSVQVERIYPEDDEYARGMMIRVTDQGLIDKTGGIVQGMSGSPIIQNGKLIGAVTHVLVGDPTCGYAISIDKMIAQMLG